MLGKSVGVTSTRKGSQTLQLCLSGLGRKGELREIAQATSTGTSIGIELTDSSLKALHDLPEKVRLYVPMLGHPLRVTVDGAATDINVGWLTNLSPDSFHEWVVKAVQHFDEMKSPLDSHEREYRRHRLGRYAFKETPSHFWPAQVPEYREQDVRLVASRMGRSLLCLRGIAVQSIATPGFVGVINSDSVVPDASRRQALQFDVKPILARATGAITPSITSNLDKFNEKGFLITRMRDVSVCTDAYGSECLTQSSLAWMQVLEKTGAMRLLSVRSFSDLIADQRSVFFSYNSGPWGTLKTWARLQNVGNDCKYAVCFDDSDGSPGYLSGHETKQGKLIEVWEEIQRAFLMRVVLEELADRWGMEKTQLLLQDGWTHEGSSVYGFCTQS